MWESVQRSGQRVRRREQRVRRREQRVRRREQRVRRTAVAQYCVGYAELYVVC